MAAALLESATQRMGAVETHFGYEGSREAFVARLMRGAPKGSVTQWEHTQREEEEMAGAQLSRYSREHGGVDTADDSSSVLNFDTVSEKVRASFLHLRPHVVWNGGILFFNRSFFFRSPVVSTSLDLYQCNERKRLCYWPVTYSPPVGLYVPVGLSVCLESVLWQNG